MTEQQLIETTGFLTDRGFRDIKTGIILGTGMSKLPEHLEIVTELDYSAIPNFPVATVEFHHGRLIHGRLEGHDLMVMNGRFHYYEGYSLRQVTFPVRVMKKLGLERLILSNAAGTMNPAFRKGGLMLLKDHIDLLPDNPLRGPNFDSQGTRFPDMSIPYNKELNNKIKTIAQQLSVEFFEGVYVAVAGPNLETRAEYRYLRLIGADAVGMSTVPEVIVANQVGLPVAAISVLTDECDPDNLQPVVLEELLAVAAEAEKKLIKVILELIRSL